jgi:hypothetical protein
VAITIRSICGRATNEELHEHAIDISTYTYICLYDAITTSIRAHLPSSYPIQFVGMAYANVDIEMYDNFQGGKSHGRVG